jgi:hypothetical protein
MPQGMTRPIGVKPEGSKVDRMAAQSAKIEAGHVHLPNSAPWLGEFLTELCHFQTVVTMIRSIAFLSSSDGCRTIRIICSPLSRRSSSPDRENFLSMLAPRIGHHSMIRLTLLAREHPIPRLKFLVLRCFCLLDLVSHTRPSLGI